ncbi:MAG: hypothetical protein A2724_10115 [Fluviicola sp. RIFCSPHIGHO2_01_FULL_43_53]|nr:MAG: hypothetical protein CHH17_17615 [Candidatus Fluviicola riflensis]OGS84997.1 MAG: hypothetical protein A2724_10115 [Fluviicola sp. RIFCSPHIGHO2_01_FULL_43_53]
MKLLLLIFTLVSLSATAQQNPSSRMEQPSGMNYFSRLGVDYEIKDNPSPDADVIALIPFEIYNRQRHATQDLEFTDPTTNYVIILYSEEKCRLNKQQ